MTPRPDTRPEALELQEGMEFDDDFGYFEIDVPPLRTIVESRGVLLDEVRAIKERLRG